MHPTPRTGERAPDLILPLNGGALTHLYALLGGAPSVLLLAPSARLDRSALQRALGGWDIVEIGPALDADACTDAAGAARLSDPDGSARVRLGATDAAPSHALILDANLRVLDRLPLTAHTTADTLAERAQAAWDTRPRVEARRVRAQAPVLLIPDALDLKACAFLQRVWHAKASETGAVERSGARGQRSDVVAHDFKRRRDHTVRDPGLIRMLTASIGRRIFPELRRAFGAEMDRFEGFKIARYGADDRGVFRAHRDNLSPSTAHRRFALTLGLGGDYQGGALRFPEHAPHLYVPEPGEAIVFACDLLHEVTEVTEGERFVLISFLYSGAR